MTNDPPAISKSEPQFHEVTLEGEGSYCVDVSGTLDEWNTTQHRRMHGLYTVAEEPMFQPNVSLEIANIGTTKIVAPRLVVNGERNWFDMPSLLGGLGVDGLTDEEKAFRIFGFFSRSDVNAHNRRAFVGPDSPGVDRPPSFNGFEERGDPIRSLNTYYCSACPHASSNLVVTARAAGLDARVVSFSAIGEVPTRHTAAEIFYDDSWHLFDPELRAFFLHRDRRTVASAADLLADPSLIIRTHCHGPAALDFPEGFWWRKMFAQDAPVASMPVEDWHESVDFELRPGESFKYKWGHSGKFYYGDKDGKYDQPFPPPRLANCLFVYEPDLTEAATLRSATDCENVEVSPLGVGLADQRWPGRLVFRVRSPFPIVGARLEIANVHCSSAIGIDVSDGGDWVEAASRNSETLHLSLDEFLPTLRGRPLRAYYVRLRFPQRCQSEVSRLRLESDVQLSETALPALRVGSNLVRFSHMSASTPSVRLRHEWCESDAFQAPPSPLSAISPEDEAGGIDLSPDLSWAVYDRTALAGYHIVVMDRPHLEVPTAPNLDRMFAGGEPRWSIEPGWLRPATTYYWRVRALSTEGVWSAWGKLWSFTTGAAEIGSPPDL